MEELDALEKYYNLLVPNKPTFKRSYRLDEWIKTLRMIAEQELKRRSKNET